MSEQLELFPQEELEQKLEIEQLPTITDAEWCFQFFNNEPIVFAWQDEGSEPAPLVLQIQPKEGEGLNFQQNGMIFRIFPRPISEESKKQRQEENASKNQEITSESSNS
jgi:hypothetical protein